MSSSTSPNVRQLLRQACARIERADAEVLLAHALGRDRAWLFAHALDAIDATAVERFGDLVTRRVDGEPVAYLTGRRGFWSLDLEVTHDTLIPRPDTEVLVEQALRRLPVDVSGAVADLGTGSGAVALAIASERPSMRMLATDVSDAALRVARANAVRLGLRNVEFRKGEWLAPLPDLQLDMIVSNPPYIETHDPHLGRGDLRVEPTVALASGGDGLDAIRVIVRDAHAHLQPGGWLLLEHGWNQGEAVRALLHETRYVEVVTVRDLEHRDRVVVARRPDSL